MGEVAEVGVDVRPRKPFSVRTSPVRVPTKVTVAPGRRWRTS